MRIEPHGTSTFTGARSARRSILLGVAALALAGFFAGLQVSTWPIRLRYPGELNDIEGMRLVEMLHLRQGVPIYALPSAERFDASIYGPVYYLLGARLVDPVAPSYLPLRLLSALGTLGLAAGCGVLALWLTRRALAAALAPLLFLSYGFVTRHGLSARSDVVAVLVAFIGFLLVFRFQRDRRILLAIPFMLLSFFYKQQYVAGPLAVLVFLLFERRYRRALEFAALLAAGGLALLAIFQFLVFPGQAFFEHFLLYNVTPFSWQQFKYAGLMFFTLVLLVPLLLAGEFLRRHRNRLLGCYLGCGVVLALVTVAKVGSDAHYWLESVLALSALVAALIAERVAAREGITEVVVLLGVALFFARLFTPPSPGPRDFARDQAIQTYLRRNFPPGTLALSHWAGDLVRAGLDLPVSDPDQYLYLARRRILSDQPLLEQIRGHRFGALVFDYDLRDAQAAASRGDRLPSAWSQAILSSYDLKASLEMPDAEKVLPTDRFYIWVPRSEAPPVEPRMKE
jgi:hypothetical protein